MTQQDIIDICRRAADAAGIPQLLLVACACAESGLNPFARRPENPADDERYWVDVSFGVWQQTIRWAPEYAGGGSYPGADEIERVGALYRDSGHAAAVAAANLKGKYFPDEDDAVFKALCRYNWPGGHGQPASDEIAANYRRGITEALALLGGAAMPEPMTYNPDAQVDLQEDPFSCSEQSAQWLLRALGRNPGDAWIRGQFLPNGLMTAEYGLMDASGASLAAWLQREYGDEMGLTFTNKNGASWDDIAAIAGRQPVMIGGRAWNHWSGVRRLQEGGLELANPAPNWKDVGTLLDRAEFDRYGSWSYVTVAPNAAPTPVPTDPRDGIIADLKQQLAEKQRQLDGFINATAYLGDDIGDRIQAAADELRRVRRETVGPRP